MQRPYFYSPFEQPQATQWQYQPSFYNGYSTNIPVSIHQPAPVVQTYYPPIERLEPELVIPSSPTPSSMIAYNLLRNPFSRSPPYQRQHYVDQTNNEFLYHEQQLNRNLAKHNIERLPVKGDGNCLFYALAEGLMYEMKVDPRGFGYDLRQLFLLPLQFRLVDFASRLRQLCVEQWKVHEHYYGQFIDRENVSFLKEVRKFSKNGVSDSILGDIVPLTIANTLSINIVIFTSVANLPRIDVKPERKASSSAAERKTIHLAYNQYGAGHYDAAYPRL